jgi:hypothetical protein
MLDETAESRRSHFRLFLGLFAPPPPLTKSVNQRRSVLQEGIYMDHTRVDVSCGNFSRVDYHFPSHTVP